MAYNWIPILGQFVYEDETVVFKGGKSTMPDGRFLYNVGNYICDQNFGGGIISGEVEFPSSGQNEACEFIIVYYPPAQAFTTAGLGGGGLCAVRTWTGSPGGQWITHAVSGDRSQLMPNHSYNLSVLVRGSRAKVTIDGVDVIDATLPFPLPRGQAGIWCMGESDIKISHYKISAERPKVFVVMQFTPPYNELYSDVIVPVCDELDLATVRADETYGPGLIVADIAREIIEAKIIIADITPANPNVYYEVGYAHALRKPTILIAEKPTQLPFDVSPYRVLFYENTIGGKAKVEAGLRKHLMAIQTTWGT
jgi:hypothetical protein